MKDRPVKDIILSTLVFFACVAMMVSVMPFHSDRSGQSGFSDSDAILSALGIGVCIVSGIILLKAARIYLVEPNTTKKTD
jgi:hypothetical protein